MTSKKLETKMADAFSKEEFPRKKDKDALETKVIQGFKNGEERKKDRQFMTN